MEEQPEHEQAEEGSEQQASPQGSDQGPPAEQADVPRRPGRLRRAFGFLRSPLFWGGLATGVVVLGAGVAIGWAAAGWVDDDGRRDRSKVSFRVAPDQEWDGKRRWERGAGWWGPERGDLPYRGDSVPGEVWERVEDLIEEVENLVERVADYVEDAEDYGGFLDGFFEGDFRDGGDWQGPFPDEGLGAFLDRFFGSDRSLDDDFWSGDGGRDGLFDDGYDRGDERSEEGSDGFGKEGDFWGDGEKGGFFGRFGFPIPGFPPGFMMLEDCDLDLADMPEFLESLPEAPDDEIADEDLEEFFEAMEEMIREACEEGSDG